MASEINPIEKKPLFHFFPGSFAYSIATVGCNLDCSFCQNWSISQWPKGSLPKHIRVGKESMTAVGERLAALGDTVPGEPMTPENIVKASLANGCSSISYTFTEPTIFYELAYDTAVLAKKWGLKNTLCEQRLYR